jgi:nucleoside-diphosphate-sugar epimerase
MKISVVGQGWFGTPLSETLKVSGHHVIGTNRSPSAPYPLNPPQKPHPDIMQADCMIINIPPFENQLEWFKSWDWNPKTWVILISSTGVPPVLASEEEWVKKSFQFWTIIRFGGLLGGERHPGKHLSGRTGIKGKDWPVNLIHLDDCIGLTEAVLKRRVLRQTINGVCDEHSTKKEFYTRYAQNHGLALPEFDETDSTVGKLVTNEDAKAFYTFKHPRLIGL